MPPKKKRKQTEAPPPPPLDPKLYDKLPNWAIFSNDEPNSFVRPFITYLAAKHGAPHYFDFAVLPKDDAKEYIRHLRESSGDPKDSQRKVEIRTRTEKEIQSYVTKHFPASPCAHPYGPKLSNWNIISEFKPNENVSDFFTHLAETHADPPYFDLAELPKDEIRKYELYLISKSRPPEFTERKNEKRKRIEKEIQEYITEHFPKSPCAHPYGPKLPNWDVLSAFEPNENVRQFLVHLAETNPDPPFFDLNEITNVELDAYDTHLKERRHPHPLNEKNRKLVRNEILEYITNYFPDCRLERESNEGLPGYKKKTPRSNMPKSDEDQPKLDERLPNWEIFSNFLPNNRVRPFLVFLAARHPDPPYDLNTITAGDIANDLLAFDTVLRNKANPPNDESIGRIGKDIKTYIKEHFPTSEAANELEANPTIKEWIDGPLPYNDQYPNWQIFQENPPDSKMRDFLTFLDKTHPEPYDLNKITVVDITDYAFEVYSQRKPITVYNYPGNQQTVFRAIEEAEQTLPEPPYGCYHLRKQADGSYEVRTSKADKNPQRINLIGDASRAAARIQRRGADQAKKKTATAIVNYLTTNFPDSDATQMVAENQTLSAWAEMLPYDERYPNWQTFCENKPSGNVRRFLGFLADRYPYPPFYDLRTIAADDVTAYDTHMQTSENPPADITKRLHGYSILTYISNAFPDSDVARMIAENPTIDGWIHAGAIAEARIEFVDFEVNPDHPHAQIFNDARPDQDVIPFLTFLKEKNPYFDISAITHDDIKDFDTHLNTIQYLPDAETRARYSDAIIDYVTANFIGSDGALMVLSDPTLRAWAEWEPERQLIDPAVQFPELAQWPDASNILDYPAASMPGAEFMEPVFSAAWDRLVAEDPTIQPRENVPWEQRFARILQTPNTTFQDLLDWGLEDSDGPDDASMRDVDEQDSDVDSQDAADPSSRKRKGGDLSESSVQKKIATVHARAATDAAEKDNFAVELMDHLMTGPQAGDAEFSEAQASLRQILADPLRQGYIAEFLSANMFRAEDIQKLRDADMGLDGLGTGRGIVPDDSTLFLALYPNGRPLVDLSGAQAEAAIAQGLDLAGIQSSGAALQEGIPHRPSPPKPLEESEIRSGGESHADSRGVGIAPQATLLIADPGAEQGHATSRRSSSEPLEEEADTDISGHAAPQSVSSRMTRRRLETVQDKDNFLLSGIETSSAGMRSTQGGQGRGGGIERPDKTAKRGGRGRA